MAFEKKLGKPFADIASGQVFQPFGKVRASQVQASWMQGYRITPVDESGAFRSHFPLQMRYWNAADDYDATV